MKKLIQLSFLLLLLFVANLDAAVTVQLDFVQPNSQLDDSDYPTLKARIKVYKDGVLTPVGSENCYILESNRMSMAEGISDPVVGWQTVSWKTRFRGFNSEFHQFAVIVKIDKEVGIGSGFFGMPNYSFVNFADSDYESISEIYLGQTTLGETVFKQMRVAIRQALKDENGYATKVRVDSASFKNGVFKYFWRGTNTNYDPPPQSYTGASFCLVDLESVNGGFDYKEDYFNVYYDNGAVASLRVTGNTYYIGQEKMLKLIEPLGGEAYAPCQDVVISWEGSSDAIPTLVEYSIDGGYSWDLIEETQDTTIVWSVPKNVETEKALVRVRQEFSKTDRVNLTQEPIPVQKLSYNGNGKKMLSVNTAGRIYEMDGITGDVLNNYELNVNGDILVYGIEYLHDDKFFVVYKMNNRIDLEIAYFNVGQASPENEYIFDTRVPIKEVLIDSSRTKLIALPSLSPVVQFFDASDGDFINEKVFDHPVYAAKVNLYMNQLAVYMFNGDLDIYNIDDMSFSSSLDLSDIPLVGQIGMSWDGKFIGVGCLPPTNVAFESNRSEVHVVETATNRKVRTWRNAASLPVGLEFNKTGNVMIAGFESTPQVIIYDLSSGAAAGSLAGSDTKLTDLLFSPEGHSAIYSFEGKGTNLLMQNFTYPEADTTQEYIVIEIPPLAIDTVRDVTKYMGTVNDLSYNKVITNEGRAIFIIDSAYFDTGIHYENIHWNYPDTLKPGESRNIDYVYNPLDTGKIVDSLVIMGRCIPERFAIFEHTSLDRNFEFVLDDYNFGDVCVGEESIKKFAIIKNLDPVPLKLNQIVFDPPLGSPFTTVNWGGDTLIAPNDQISWEISYKPYSFGLNERQMRIYHSDQIKIYKEKRVWGVGIGTELNYSHANLPFIPEIDTRVLTLTNITENVVTLNEIIIQPEGAFEVLTSFPIVLDVDESIDVEIKCIDFSKEAELKVMAEPCMVNSSIKLVQYYGTSVLSIPIVEANPRGDADIPIRYDNDNNDSYSYQGERVFETEISLNPRLFLPKKAISEKGEAEIIRNEIVNDKRIIGVRVKGNFDEDGVVATINGYAGLGEVDHTSIDFIENSVYWGERVSVSTSGGTLKIIDIYADRLVLRPGQVSIQGIAPNPSVSTFKVDFYTEDAGNVDIEIYDNLGQKKYSSTVNAVEGNNENIEIKSELSPGTYRLVIRSEENFDSETIVIIK